MAQDVIITPANGQIDFQDNNVSVAKIDIDSSNNLSITNSGGDLSIGNTSSDVYIGDGTNNVDLIFEQNGSIRGTGSQTITLGQSGDTISVAGSTFNPQSDIVFTTAATRGIYFNNTSGNQVYVRLLGSTELDLGSDNRIRFVETDGGSVRAVFDLNSGKAKVGNGASETPVATWQIEENNESTTQTDFTQAVTKAGLLMETQYTADAYTPGLFWMTNNNNSSKPKAGIYLQLASSGSRMLFGTSNNYGTGLTNTAMVINESGYVGIGTTSPDSKLEIAGGNYNSSLKIKGLGDTTGIQFEDSAGNTDGYIYAEGGSIGLLDSGASWMIQCQNDSYIRFATNGNTEHMRIKSDGNVGIGTTNPSNRLHIQYSEASSTQGLFIHNTINAGDAGIKFSDASNVTQNGIFYYAHSDSSSNGTGNSFHFNSDQSTLAVILDQTGGNCGYYIGESSPVVAIRGGGDSFFNGGNLGIGTASPAYPLDVRTASVGAMQVKGAETHGLLLGEAAYSQNNDYTGLKTSLMTGASDYMIISGSTTDGNTYVSAKSGNNLHLRAGGNSQNDEIVISASTGVTYKSSVQHEFSTGNVGINTSTVNVKLAVNGEASFGDESRLSLIGLSIATSATSPNIKIRTKIPFALGSADFTVNIKGFIYGNAETANLTVCWHYYNSTFYNATCSSSGGWAPTIQLSAEDWDSSGTKKVCICLSTPGYWVKAYVESMFSHSYNDNYADGWTWVDETASGTGNDLASLSYRSDFGNNFRMLSSGSVGVGVTPSRRFQVNGVVSFRPNGSSNDQHYFTTSTANNPQYLMYNSGGSLINKFAVAADSYITGGNVGIGGATANQTLTITNPSTGDWDKGLGFRLGSTDTAKIIVDSAGLKFRTFVSGDDFYFRNSANTTTLIITGAGNVGVGTANPAYRLEVEASVTGDWVSRINNTATTNTPNGVIIKTGYNASTATGGYLFACLAGTDYRFAVQNDGNVGVGSILPTATLDVNGTGKFSSHLTLAGDATSMLYFGSKRAIEGQIANNNLDLGESFANIRLRSSADVFPTNSVNLGTSSNRWSTIYGNKILVNGADDNGGTADFSVETGGSTPEISWRSNGQVQIGSNDMNWNSRIVYDGATRFYSWDNDIVIGAGYNSNSNSRDLSLYAATSSNTPSEYLRCDGSAGTIVLSKPLSGTTATFSGTLDVNGNVGIGITAPDGSLQVKSGASGSYVIRGQNSSGNDLGGLYDASGDAEIYLKTAATATGVKLDSAGDSYFLNSVGIGIASPAANLHVYYSSGVTDIKAGFLSGTGGPGIRGQNTSTTANTYFPIDFRVSDADARIAFQYNGTSNQGQFLFITEANSNSPKFGIYDKGDGATRILVNDTATSTAPNKTLHAKWSSSDTTITTGNGLLGGGAGAGILLENTSTTAGIYANLDFRAYDADARIALKKAAANTGDFYFIHDNNGAANTSVVMRSNGSVGIGTTNPSAPLEVYYSGSSSVPGIVLTNTNNGGTSSIVFRDDGGTRKWACGYNDATNDWRVSQSSGSSSGNLEYPKLVVRDGGNVGIGYTFPSGKLAVNGSVGVGTSSPGSQLQVNGDIQIQNTGSNSFTFIGNKNGPNPYFLNGTTIFEWVTYNSAQSAVISYFGLATDSDGQGLICAGSSSYTPRIAIGASTGNVGIGTASNSSYKLQVNGSFAASSKNFVIDHPTKENKQLVHGSLEGPENGVYYRGRAQSSTISLPDYWSGLVREDTITVQLTPRGGFQHLYVVSASLSQIVIGAAEDETIDCFYTIYGERADIDSLVVEKDV